MILKLIRYNHDQNSTSGLLMINGQFACYTLEDEERCQKIHGQTRIPAGNYQVKFREAVTPLTEKYKERFDFFTYHLEIQNVPGFKYVYIHIGNTHFDSEGCLLVGTGSETLINNSESFISNSTEAFKQIYPVIAGALDTGEEVWVTIEEIG